MALTTAIYGIVKFYGLPLIRPAEVELETGRNGSPLVFDNNPNNYNNNVLESVIDSNNNLSNSVIDSCSNVLKNKIYFIFY